MPRYDGTCHDCGTPVTGHEVYCPACRRERQRKRQRAYEARKRESRAPFKPCVACGRLLVPAGTQKQLCDDCRIEHRKAHDNHNLRNKKNGGRRSYGTVNRAREAAGLAPYRGKPAKGQRVEDIIRAAAEEGVSYGKYIQRHGL